MKVASTTSASAIMTDWLMPIMIDGMASGSLTLTRSWMPVEPNERAASTISGSTWRMPRLVSRTAGGRA